MCEIQFLYENSRLDGLTTELGKLKKEVDELYPLNLCSVPIAVKLSMNYKIWMQFLVQWSCIVINLFLSYLLHKQ